MLIYDKCADNLFDILIEFQDFGEIETFATLHPLENQIETEISKFSTLGNLAKPLETWFRMEDKVFEEEYADNFSDVPSDAEDKGGSDNNGEENIESGEVEDSFPQLRRNNSVRIFYIIYYINSVRSQRVSNSDDEESDGEPFPPPRKKRRVLCIRSSSEEEGDEERENPFPPPRRNLRRHRMSNSSDEDENEKDTIGWSDIDRPRDNEAFEGATGPRVSVNHCDSVEEVVNCFGGDDLLEFIAVETNKYHAQNYRKFKSGKKCATRRDVTISDLKNFFGLVINMGLVKKQELATIGPLTPLLKHQFFQKT